jgi:hypothetical protein
MLDSMGLEAESRGYPADRLIAGTDDHVAYELTRCVRDLRLSGLVLKLPYMIQDPPLHIVLEQFERLEPIVAELHGIEVAQL